MHIHYATLSKTGKRPNNEDAWKIIHSAESQQWTGIVCDGLGGHDFGEEASEVVTQAISEYWQKHQEEKDSESMIKEACQFAYNALNKRAHELRCVGMGTTMVMASIKENVVTIAHAGDSRCYLLRPDKGVLYKTKDHVDSSFGWEILSKCFFSYDPKFEPDVAQFPLETGDRLFLCSDGVYKSLLSSTLQELLLDHNTPEDILNELDILCEEYGYDNYTVILAIIE